ncbi:MAG: hypothetical protein GPJ51_02675 [Candidatus Heimdallarchaeota archaeon]|nr:hypothetical protein [Candidatus Heimdallarchaeota archaeon]
MAEVYQFKCLECDLEFKVGCGVGGSSDYPRTRFLCVDCNKVSMDSKCEHCGKYLKRVIFPLQGNTYHLEECEEGLKLPCPHCSSDHTVLTLLDKWVMNFQIW